MLPSLANVAILLERNLRLTRLLSGKLQLKSRLCAQSMMLRGRWTRLGPGMRSLTAWFGIYVLLLVSIRFTRLNILLGALLVTMLLMPELVLGPFSMTMWLIRLSYMLTRRLIIISALRARLRMRWIVLRILPILLGLRPVAGLLSSSRLGRTVSMFVKVRCRCRLLESFCAEWLNVTQLSLMTLRVVCVWP